MALAPPACSVFSNILRPVTAAALAPPACSVFSNILRPVTAAALAPPACSAQPRVRGHVSARPSPATTSPVRGCDPRLTPGWREPGRDRPQPLTHPCGVWRRWSGSGRRRDACMRMRGGARMPRSPSSARSPASAERRGFDLARLGWTRAFVPVSQQSTQTAKGAGELKGARGLGEDGVDEGGGGAAEVPVARVDNGPQPQPRRRPLLPAPPMTRRLPRDAPPRAAMHAVGAHSRRGRETRWPRRHQECGGPDMVVK